MKVIKKCEICGNTFEGNNGKAKYCSDKCRAIGTNQRRQEWITRTGYYEKQNEKQRLKRAGITAEQLKERKAQEQRERKNAKRRQSYAITKREEKLSAKANAGDTIAGLSLAMRKYSTVDFEYWQALKEYELSFCAEHGFKCSRTVNGISIHDDDFAFKVAQSVQECGRIISQS